MHEEKFHEKFNDGRRAAAYVFSGIAADFPGEQFQLIYERRKQTVEQVCTAQQLGHELALLCSRFPMASAYYTPDDPEGAIGQVRCHCRNEGNTWCCMAGGHHHARVRINLVRAPAAVAVQVSQEGATG